MTELRTLIAGLAYGESPRWHDGRLWFCHWTVGEVVVMAPDGSSEVVLTVPATTLPFCIDWLPDGRLLLVCGPEGRVLRRESDGSLAAHADLRRLATGPWNEIVTDDRGRAYVNGGRFEDGLVALVGPDGSVEPVADGLAFANGMALTTDGSTLIVAESHGGRLTAFDVGPDGRLANRRVWADVAPGAPDGICLDAEGAVWYADVPNRRCVRVREGGEVLATVQADRGCFACALGGRDGRTLYVTAAEWRGMEAMFDGRRTGVVLAAPAPARASA
jgi:sugar lactone lactonase YvrE